MNIQFCDLDRLHAPHLGELRSAFDRVLRRSRFVLDFEVARFEEAWAMYCQRKHAIGVGCGLDALTILLRAYGIGPGEEVLVASNTFIATWMAVSTVGATPVPVEPSSSSMTMEPDEAEKRISHRTAAILTTHLYGNVSDMDRLGALARSHGIPLLVDACQAHGVKGADLGDGAAFSFYPTKNLGCIGDGGAVVVDSDEIAILVRALRNYGGRQKDEHLFRGMNSRLDEIQAAILYAKLPYLEEWNQNRQRNAMMYATLLSQATADVGFAFFSDSVNHIFPIMSLDRDRLRSLLKDLGVATMIHYPTAPNQQPCYRSMERQPIAEQIAGEILSLPVGPEIGRVEIEYVVAALVEAKMRTAA